MPGRADAQAALARDADHVAAQLLQLALTSAGVRQTGRRDLEHRLHQLGVDPLLELVAGDRREHGLDVLDEVERLAVEEHVLLLDAQRVRVAVAELVVEHAAPACEALARDRLRDRSASRGLRRTASASISTQPARVEQLGHDAVAAGRISAKTSPWARAISGQSARSVT